MTMVTMMHGSDQRDLHLVDRAFDEHRVVAGDLELRALGQDFGDRRDRLLDALGNIERVRLRLPDDAEPDALTAVGAQRRGADIRPERHRGDVAEADIVAEHQVLELFRRLQVGGGAHRNVLVGAGQRARPARRAMRVASASRRLATVSPRPASFDWLMSMRKIFSWSPLICTSATPSTAASRSVISFSASSVRSSIDSVSEVSASRMIGWLSESALTMRGSSASSGNWFGHAPERVANVVGGLADVGRVGKLQRHAALRILRGRGDRS